MTATIPTGTDTTPTQHTPFPQTVGAPDTARTPRRPLDANDHNGFALRLTVVTAGLSQPSSTRVLADRLAAATHHHLQRRSYEVTTTTVDLRQHAHSLIEHLLTGSPPPDLVPVHNAVTTADGVVAVTPIFKASYSGLFKLFFDTFNADALRGVPVLIAATGGTTRHSLALDHALRPLFAHLHAIVLPTGLYALSDDLTTAGSLGTRRNGAALLSRRIDDATRELADELTRRTPATSSSRTESPSATNRATETRGA